MKVDIATIAFALMFGIPVAAALKVLLFQHDPYSRYVHPPESRPTVLGLDLFGLLRRRWHPAWPPEAEEDDDADIQGTA